MAEPLVAQYGPDVPQAIARMVRAVHPRFDADAFLHDALSGSHYLWQGPRNFVSLDPQRSPVHVMELRSRMKRENDFDYFL